MRVKIVLETLSDVKEFVDIMSNVKSRAVLVDKDRNFVVNAKSLLGAMYSVEWDEVWLESDEDIYSQIRKFAD
jgi:hypothetical protein